MPMKRPSPDSLSAPQAYLASRNGLVRSSASRPSQRSSGKSATGATCWKPAFAITASSRPKRSSARSTAARLPSRVVRSARNASPGPSSAGLRSTASTCAPSSASRSAIALPIPLAAPVTRAARPEMVLSPARPGTLAFPIPKGVTRLELEPHIPVARADTPALGELGRVHARDRQRHDRLLDRGPLPRRNAVGRGRRCAALVGRHDRPREAELVVAQRARPVEPDRGPARLLGRLAGACEAHARPPAPGRPPLVDRRLQRRAEPDLHDQGRRAGAGLVDGVAPGGAPHPRTAGGGWGLVEGLAGPAALNKARDGRGLRRLPRPLPGADRRAGEPDRRLPGG